MHQSMRHLTCAAILLAIAAPRVEVAAAADSILGAEADPAAVAARPLAPASGFTLPGPARLAASEFVAEAHRGGAGSFPHASIATTRFEAVRYRPRRERPYRHHRSPRARGVFQFHAGYLDPDGPPDPGFVAGFRAGQRLEEVLEIGLGVDWRTKSGRTTEVLQSSTGPGGEVIGVRRELSRHSSDLLPVMLYLQVSGPSRLLLVPYAAVAGSYQALFLSAEDFQTGESFDATYDGFGWQAWGGVKLPLAGRLALLGEVFLNDAELHRDLFDPLSGETIRETVRVDGLGARFGLSWGF